MLKFLEDEELDEVFRGITIDRLDPDSTEVSSRIERLLRRFEPEDIDMNKIAIFSYLKRACWRANQPAAAVKFAQREFDEVGMNSSLESLSYAMARAGEFERALVNIEKAFHTALDEKDYPKDAAQTWLQIAVNSGNVGYINEALSKIANSNLSDVDNRSFDWSWLQGARKLGADTVKIDALVEVMSRK